jgi:hypothetical protein
MRVRKFSFTITGEGENEDAKNPNYRVIVSRQGYVGTGYECWSWGSAPGITPPIPVCKS